MTTLAWSLAAWAAFALAMERHHEQVLARTPGRPVSRRLRAAGTLLLLACLAESVRTQGWSFGALQWLASATVAGLAMVLLLAWRPRALPPLAMFALVLGAAAAGAG